MTLPPNNTEKIDCADCKDFQATLQQCVEHARMAFGGITHTHKVVQSLLRESPPLGKTELGTTPAEEFTPDQIDTVMLRLESISPSKAAQKLLWYFVPRTLELLLPVTDSDRHQSLPWAGYPCLDFFTSAIANQNWDHWPDKNRSVVEQYFTTLWRHTVHCTTQRHRFAYGEHGLTNVYESLPWLFERPDEFIDELTNGASSSAVANLACTLKDLLFETTLFDNEKRTAHTQLWFEKFESALKQRSCIKKIRQHSETLPPGPTRDYLSEVWEAIQWFE